MQELRYLEKQKELQKSYEARCQRCGACCGAYDGDPCSNLGEDAMNTYYCREYEARLGLQKTISGKTFTCVPIREVLKFDSVHLLCVYRR